MMTKTRNALSMILIAAALALGGGARAAIVVVLPIDHDLPPLELREQHISARIDGLAAETSIQQVFHNPHNRQLEARYVLSLPPEALVTDLRMTVNGEETRAQALPREEARRLYDAIVRRTRDPGLLEYLDSRTYAVSVFPVPAHGDLPVEIRYAQTLRREGGLFAYDLDAPGGAGWDNAREQSLQLDLRAAGEIGIAYSPTHAVAVDRAPDGRGATVRLEDGNLAAEPFTLLFDIEENELGMHVLAHRDPRDAAGTFLLLITPPREGALAKPLPKSVVFVLDTSGSMAKDGKMEKARAALLQAIAGLNPDDEFDVVAFSTTIEPFARGLNPASDEHISRASRWLHDLRPRGGTNIHDALVRAADILKRDGDRPLKQIVFMTDGLPTAGRTDKAQIVHGFKTAAGRTDMRVFTVGFGYDVNAPLLDTIAAETRAASDYIRPTEDVELKMDALFQKISYPVLVAPTLELDGLDTFDVFPTELPDFFVGSEILVTGRYRGDGGFSATLTGETGIEPYHATIETTLPPETSEATRYVEALWANRKVAFLLGEIRANGPDKELVDEVIALATEFNLVTPYTSFLTAPDGELLDAGGLPAAGGRHLTVTAPMITREEMSRGASRALSSDSGEGAVNYSMSKNSLMMSSNVNAAAAAPEARRAASSRLGYKVVNKRLFTRENAEAPWVERGAKTDSTVVNVKYLSNAYYQLLERFPEHRAAIILGENVTVNINNVTVTISETGAEEELPDALKQD